MAYIAPYIDEAGLHIPSYQDIVDDMVEGAKAIFGDDLYLENDSADYQLISIFALKQYDMLQAIQYAYNSRSPVTAVGSALDTVVKLNGIRRKAESRSTCKVVITGTPYTQISNGRITDRNSIVWNLPEMVIIPASGTLESIATCSVPGGITVAIGDLSQIDTPTYGWLNVTNNEIAVVGSPQESDADLRRRQAISVSLPSQTLLDGTLAAIDAIEDVKRVAVYENDTNSSAVTPQNPHGLPPHSVTCVVEGGDDYDIAESILYHKGIGCYTNGDTEIEVAGSNGYINYVRFYRPDYVDVHVDIKLKKYPGFVNNVLKKVQKAIDEYLKLLTIGSDVSISMLITMAMACNDDINKPTFGIHSIQIGRTAGALSSADIVIAYNEIPNSVLENIVVEVV